MVDSAHDGRDGGKDGVQTLAPKDSGCLSSSFTPSKERGPFASTNARSRLNLVLFEGLYIWCSNLE